MSARPAGRARRAAAVAALTGAIVLAANGTAAGGGGDVPARPLAQPAALAFAAGPGVMAAQGMTGAGSVAGAGVASAPSASAAATRTVRVADNFFAPRRLTVRRGTTIRWRWSNANADTHDVFLRRRPKGVRRFSSPPAATHFSYRRKLRKPGVYRLICTFHQGMAMRVRVRGR